MSGPEDRRGTDGGEHPLDVDARFADIVSHFHDDEPTRPRLVDDHDEDRDTGSTPGSVDVGDPRPATGPAPDGPALAADEASGPTATHERGTDERGTDERGTDERAGHDRAIHDRAAAAEARAFDAEVAAERRALEAKVAAEVDRAVDGADGGRFVPEDPPPLPRPDLPGRLAWAAVLAGPVLLLLCALLWRSAPPWLLGSIVTAVVAGFGFLVWRLPRTRDRDDRDDGAIV